MKSTQTTRKFKLSVIGDGATGKTVFIGKHSTSIFEKQYVFTMVTRVYPIRFHTNKGDVLCNCWDISGLKSLSRVGIGHHFGSDAALVFFDFGSKSTLSNTLKWKSDFNKECKNVPMVLCGNKVDLVSKVDERSPPALHGDERSPPVNIKCKFDDYCELSTKTGFNFKKPFLKVLKLLMGSDTEIIT